MNSCRALRAVLLFLACFGTAFAEAHHLAVWRLVDLGVLRPGGQSFGIALNDRGEVTGYASVESSVTMHAFLWRDGVMRDLGLPAGASGVIANDISAHGVIAGATTDAQPVAWKDGTWTSLPFKGDVAAVDHDGDIAGTAIVGPHERAVLVRDGMLTDLGTLGGLAARVNGINDWGHVVGRSSLADGQSHAYLWANGEMRDVGPADRTNSVATAINNRNVIVGFASNGGSAHVTGFLWYGQTFALLPGMEGVFPAAINELNDIVGTLANDRGAFLIADAELVRVDRLQAVRAAHLTDIELRGINNHRWIVGYGTSATGAQRAFVLMPD